MSTKQIVPHVAPRTRIEAALETTAPTGSLERWAVAHNTHPAVAAAIWWLAGENGAETAQRIWEDPTRAEWLVIFERATGNGLRDGRGYAWGADCLGNVFPGDR